MLLFVVLESVCGYRFINAEISLVYSRTEQLLIYHLYSAQPLSFKLIITKLLPLYPVCL